MSHSSRNKRAKKRERFADRPARKRSVKSGTLIAILGVITLGLLGFSAFTDSSKSKSISDVTATPSEGSSIGQISLPLSDLSNGQAKFFRYKTSNGSPVRFFVIKSSDGVYRAAADACVVCYREKMGYHQDGDDMVCNKCRKHFPSAYVNEVTGGCNPDPIRRTIQGDRLLIAASDLEARTELF